jgi:hypothetical protein
MYSALSVVTLLTALTAKREIDWRVVINEMRLLFTGTLTYAARWTEAGIDWWDAVDVIGINAHYPLVANDSIPSVESLQEAWEQVIAKGYVEHTHSSVHGIQSTYCR